MARPVASANPLTACHTCHTLQQNTAHNLAADIDERDQQFITGERTSEGFYYVKNGIEQCISRGLAYAEYADLIWMETSNPDLGVAL